MYIEYERFLEMRKAFLITLFILVVFLIGFGKQTMRVGRLADQINAQEKVIEEKSLKVDRLSNRDTKLREILRDYRLELVKSGPHTIASPVETVSTSRGGTARRAKEVPYGFEFLDIEKAKEYFKEDNSMWGQGDNLELIVEVSRDFNVSPYLMLAITYAEQSGVKLSHKNYDKMSKNPYNVFGSWKDTNITLEKSARLAADVVVRGRAIEKPHLTKIQEINELYAEDTVYWHKNTLPAYKRFKKAF